MEAMWVSRSSRNPSAAPLGLRYMTETCKVEPATAPRKPNVTTSAPETATTSPSSYQYSQIATNSVCVHVCSASTGFAYIEHCDFFSFQIYPLLCIDWIRQLYITVHLLRGSLAYCYGLGDVDACCIYNHFCVCFRAVSTIQCYSDWYWFGKCSDKCQLMYYAIRDYTCPTCPWSRSNFHSQSHSDLSSRNGNIYYFQSVLQIFSFGHTIKLCFIFLQVFFMSIILHIFKKLYQEKSGQSVDIFYNEPKDLDDIKGYG